MAYSKMLLYVWPGRWDLASIDPSCLAAVMFLQLTCAEELTLVECSNPDSSPNGQLPYIVYENQVVASLSSIVHFVTNLKSRERIPILLDEQHRPPTDHAQMTAWISHVETHLGNMVACSFYSIYSNWSKVTNAALCSMLSIPHRYYVPRRLRESVRPRLEAEGLWWSTDEEVLDEKTDPIAKQQPIKPKHTFSKAFEREKALTKCRTMFDLYYQLLGRNDYFFTTLSVFDLIFAAHILLLVRPPFPERSLQQVLEEYPGLATHAEKILTSAPVPTTQPQKESASLWQLLPSKSSLKGAAQHTPTKNDQEPKLDGLNVDQRRWVWMSMAIVALTYITARSVTITRRVPTSAD